MQRGEELYSGKAKSVFASEQDDALILHFRNDTSAFDGEKVAQLDRKGMVNNKFNAFIMQHLEANGVTTHFLKVLSETDSLVRKLDMIPVECVVRNIASGSICRRLGVDDGLVLNPSTFEFFLKNDALHDPMINESHIATFGWASQADIEQMKKTTLQVNQILSKLFADAGMTLVDFKLEFGRQGDTLYLGDEFSPDGCRIWDAESREKLDKDRFRKGLGGVVEAYEEVAKRLGLQI
ncbi:phosphoribosylaminoimidazole-succinocarboxamide synthase [Arenicella chitinivorans]|uniref:Phosphoribosylaminoimidazole-succinocarboxamide synthase n=1 Tax=Arenicella chitinivorans TaxID=1329800 RepID=A0A918VI74_9GAMM|nr:phosphoribosylaminoimidazolesuccinocarboxamide synthase [Arenicella chitinivorans]GHA00829.1 phosphoribosylaminoimidazole-succinocarboxamide synthase [Arenicella chitinivorans]